MSAKAERAQILVKKSSGALIGVALSCYLSVAVSGNLNLANHALEVVSNVEPNILFLSDDSGSMDWNMITDETEGAIHLGSDAFAYYYTHPDPGVIGTNAPAANVDYWIAPTEEYLKDEGVSAPYGGIWRAWNHNYNKIYYNPNITYKPWKGVDKNGNAYVDVNATIAPYDPYDSALGVINLTTETSYDSDCGLAECQSDPVLMLEFTVDDFYPARYYTWDDSNITTAANANNGVVDADDDHTLVEIRSTTASYTRNAYDDSTGKGRSDCTDNGDNTATCTYLQEIQNFANWFSYYRKRDLIAKAAMTRVVEPIVTGRIGYATINNNTINNLPVASMNVSVNSGNKRSLFDKIFQTAPDGETPLRTKLDQAGKYFECESGDIFGSASDSIPGNVACPVQAAPAGTCQQNYTILMTDGYWNGASPTVGNVDAGNGDFDGGAYADTNENTLADVAMYYYKNDLHLLGNDVPTTARDITGYLGTTDPFEKMHQHMTTYTVGFGVQGSLATGPSDPTAGFTWPNPTDGDAEKIDDLRHTAYNGRGQFLSANDPTALSSAFDTILTEIKAGTGTATAVAFNTQEVEAGTLVFRASFNTKTNKGDLIAQRINPNGTIDPTIKWSAADKLDNKTTPSSDTRVIVTYKDTGSGTSTGAPFAWANLTSGAGSQQALLDSPQPASVAAGTNTFGDERLAYLRGQSQHEGPSEVDGEFRERAPNAGKLGDIVHSTPVFVGKPQYTGRHGGAFPTTAGETYAEFAQNNLDRDGVVYTGANDGMLHAIDTSNGSELFAYVPNLVYQNLSALTNPNYVHRYFVDLTPSINDAYMTPSSGTNANDLSWNTILVGGLGAGGKGYYAINITDPDDLDTQTSAASNVLWEFTEADDGGVGSSDLGYSFSQPLIAMSNADDGSGNQKWVAIFGNGYNSTSTDGDAHLYVVFIEAGQDGVWTANSDFYKINTGFGKAESSDTSTPNGIGGIRGIDTDLNGTVDLVYAGDLQGNLYRFDLRSTTASNWTATPKIIFKARYKSGDAFPRDIVQPITTRPIVLKHPDNGYIVITTTGSWMTVEDATSSDIQSIYGIWDDLSASPEVTMGSTTNQLVEQVFTNHSNTEHGYTVRTLTNNAVEWKNNGNASDKVKGWYIDLDVPPAGAAVGVQYPGERAVRNLQLRGGLLFVNTVIPRGIESCTTGAGGFALGFNPLNGGSGIKNIFDLNNDGTFDYYDNVGDINTIANIVTGTRFDSDVPTDSAFIGNRRFTQAGENAESMGTNTKDDDNRGRTSWREIAP